MYKERIIMVVAAVALLVIAVLVLNQTAATAKVAAEVVGQSQNGSCPFSVEGRASLRGEYSQEYGILLPRTDSGLTGPDGGVLALLSCR